MKQALIFICVILLFACSAEPSAEEIEKAIAQTVAAKPTETTPPTDTPLPTNTSTPLPTDTFVPTNTLEPTPTPTLEPTITPTIQPPEILSNLLSNISITSIDSFEDDAQFNKEWRFLYENIDIKDGILKIIGKPNWATELINKKEFGEGEGITFDFKYENDAEFDIFIRNGTWNTSEFKSVGFLIGKYNQSQLWKGKEDGGGRPLQNNNFKLAIDKWFSIAMVVDKDGFFSTILWDKEDPAKMIKIDYHLPEWGEQKWKISSTANGGFYYFDNFSFVNFDEIMN